MRRKCVLCVLVLVALLYGLTVLVELNHLSEYSTDRTNQGWSFITSEIELVAWFGQ